MPGSFSKKSYDKIPHGDIIAKHLDNMGLEVKELFKREMDGGYQKGSTPKNKIENYLGMVIHLETLLISYVSEIDSPKRIVAPKEKYYAKRMELIAQFKEAMGDGKLVDAFFALDEWEKF